jgi:hypothetical protein
MGAVATSLPTSLRTDRAAVSQESSATPRLGADRHPGLTTVVGPEAANERTMLVSWAGAVSVAWGTQVGLARHRGVYSADCG